MDRADAVVYINDRLADYLDAADRDASDGAGKTLRPIIDDALRALGTSEDDLATAIILGDSPVTGFRVQLLYRTLLQLNRDLGATMINVSTAGDSFSLRDIRAAVKEDLEQAEQMVLARFGTVEILDASASSIGYIDEGFLAPIPLI